MKNLLDSGSNPNDMRISYKIDVKLDFFNQFGPDDWTLRNFLIQTSNKYFHLMSRDTQMEKRNVLMGCNGQLCYVYLFRIINLI